MAKTKVRCAASLGGHACRYDADDLRHFPKKWDEDTDGPWLLGITHRCGCDKHIEWPEVL